RRPRIRWRARRVEIRELADGERYRQLKNVFGAEPGCFQSHDRRYRGDEIRTLRRGRGSFLEGTESTANRVAIRRPTALRIRPRRADREPPFRRSAHVDFDGHLAPRGSAAVDAVAEYLQRHGHVMRRRDRGAVQHQKPRSADPKGTPVLRHVGRPQSIIVARAARIETHYGYPANLDRSCDDRRCADMSTC